MLINFGFPGNFPISSSSRPSPTWPPAESRRQKICWYPPPYRSRKSARAWATAARPCLSEALKKQKISPRRNTAAATAALIPEKNHPVLDFHALMPEKQKEKRPVYRKTCYCSHVHSNENFVIPNCTGLFLFFLYLTLFCWFFCLLILLFSDSLVCWFSSLLILSSTFASHFPSPPDGRR